MNYEPGELIPYGDTEARAAAWAERGPDEGYEGVTVAGLAIVAQDTGRVLLAQRSLDDTDEPEVQETWEFPGGHLNDGEDPIDAALREFSEEIGLSLADTPGEVIDGWRNGGDGHYQGFVYAVPEALNLLDWTPTEEVQNVGWFNREEIAQMESASTLRPEIAATMNWNLVFPETEEDVPMDDELDEPDLSMLDLTTGPIPVHGVLAPEDTESGDSRGFNAGAVTARPYRLPFMWQETQTSGHDGSSVVGSVDRLMRKDGLIHWEGSLMPTAKAGEFAELLAFFGRFGVSVDGDKGSADIERSESTGALWFDAVRAAGLTAVAIPAFAEAYVAFGQHPQMPEEDSEEFSVLRASGDAVQFDRGPGWVTNPVETKRLHDYWTKKGQPGYAKIRWGTPGDFTRAKKLIGEKIGANSPEDLRYLNQIIAQWHHDALGYWPGDLDKPGNKTSAEAKAEREAKAGLDEDASAWELVLTSSVGIRALPPESYFTRHPDSGALVVEEPDENGIRRTYGYAGEWGVCHIGFDGQCVGVPEDPTGDYSEFHLGRTKTSDAGYLESGLITYNVKHRGAKEILSSTPEQAHFDDLNSAWAAVRLGEDDRGVWFSGVVLPDVPENHLVKIEASGQVSGEWKHGALRTLLTVNVPGFPVIRSSAEFDEQGQVTALAASAFDTAACEPSPAEKMRALAAIDAEVRFELAKSQWAAYDQPDQTQEV